MADEPNTSGAAPAATPVTPQAPAATSTSPDAQAADGNSETISLDEARKLRSEAASLRKREKDVQAQLKAYQDAEQATKDAQLSEVEKLNKSYAELQEQHEALASELLEARVYRAVSTEASKLNFILPTDMLTKLLLNDLDSIEFENGQPTNVDKLLEQLAKSTPDLIRPAAQQQQGQQAQRAPMIPAMNPERSSIASPGQQQPGRVPRLTDPGLWKS